MTIELQETLRAVFYAPFYAAFALNAYRSEGLDVRLTDAPHSPAESMQRLLRGDVDVNWGGPMRVMMAYDQDPAVDLVCFGEVVRADPFLLVGRVPNPEFRLADLVGLRVATTSEVPTPWVCLQHDLRERGIDPDSLKRVTGNAMAENAEALRQGVVDVIQIFEPYVDDLLANGVGHIWWAAANRGATAYTCFYGRRDMLTARREEFLGMMRAIYRVQRWIEASAPEVIAQTVAPYFPHLPAIRLAGAIARYKSLGIWAKTPALEPSGYARMRDSLLSHGTVKAAPLFGDAVDNTLAELVIAQGATNHR